MKTKQIINILDFHARHHIRHGRANIDNKTTVRESFDKAEFHIDRALAILKEKPPPVRPPKLVINDGVVCFENGGVDPLSAFGTTRRQLLCRADGSAGGLYGKPLRFFLDLAEEYNLNFERIDSTKNLNILALYLDDRAEKGIVVELTGADGHRTNMGKIKDTIDFVASQGYLNVIIEPWNEFNLYKDISAKDQVDHVRYWCDYANDKGLLTSAGAYCAKSISEKFDPVNSSNQIISIHRSYGDEDDVKNTVRPYVGSGKPMSFNEGHHMTVKYLCNVIRWFYAEGVRLFNYYGLRCRNLFPDLVSDPDPWRAYYKKNEQLRAELSP